jgi:uncharacterized protein (DUF3820 family)
MTPFSPEQQLAYEQRQELKSIPFGKYEGRTLYDIFQIDRQYLTWLLQQDWFWVKFGAFFDTIVRMFHRGGVDGRAQNKFSRI